MQYYDQWLQVLREVQKGALPNTTGVHEELVWRLYDFCAVSRKLADGPKNFQNLDDTFSTHRTDIPEWKVKAREMVAKVKSFSDSFAEECQWGFLNHKEVNFSAGI